MEFEMISFLRTEPFYKTLENAIRKMNSPFKMAEWGPKGIAELMIYNKDREMDFQDLYSKI